ncbi:MAG: C-terminal binding protein [Acidimicrobiales bacterium]
MRALVVALDRLAEDLAIEREVLSRYGFDIVDVHDGGPMAAAEAVLVSDTPVDAALFDRLPRCRAVGTYGVGVDNIDLLAARTRRISVVHVPDYCTEEVADHTLALLLALVRKVTVGDRLVRSGGWGTAALGSIHRLRGRRLGLVGLGRIGQAVAIRAAAFGLEVAGVDPVAEAVPGVRRSRSLLDLVRASDIISLHVPLSRRTEGIVNRDLLKQFRPGALLINTARGRLLDLAAVTSALEAERLGGVGLDVFPREPPELGALADRDDVVLTPHSAFCSAEALDQSRRSAAEALVAALLGQPHRGRVA